MKPGMKTILDVKETLLLLMALDFKKFRFLGWCCSSMSSDIVEITARFYNLQAELKPDLDLSNMLIENPTTYKCRHEEQRNYQSQVTDDHLQFQSFYKCIPQS